MQTFKVACSAQARQPPPFYPAGWPCCSHKRTDKPAPSHAPCPCQWPCMVNRDGASRESGGLPVASAPGGTDPCGTARCQCQWDSGPARGPRAPARPAAPSGGQHLTATVVLVAAAVACCDGSSESESQRPARLGFQSREVAPAPRVEALSVLRLTRCYGTDVGTVTVMLTSGHTK